MRPTWLNALTTTVYARGSVVLVPLHAEQSVTPRNTAVAAVQSHIGRKTKWKEEVEKEHAHKKAGIPAHAREGEAVEAYCSPAWRCATMQRTA